MNQIIVDVEWYEEHGKHDKELPKVIQIGAIKIDDNGKVIDTYYSLICPVNIAIIPDETFEFMHLAKEDVKNEKRFLDKAKEFFEWCGHGAFSVAQNEKTIYVLKQEYLKEGIRYPFEGSITLQELYSQYFNLDNILNFKDMCTKLSIEVDISRLHNSKYDALCVMQVYLELRKRIIEAVNEGYLFRKMYAISYANKIFHQLDCPETINNFTNYYIVPQSDVENIRCTPCKKCMVGDAMLVFLECRRQNQFKTKKPLRIRECVDINKIEAMCIAEGYKCYVNGNELLIKTDVSCWKFNPTKKKIKLFHSNDIDDFNPYGDDYHEQNRHFPDPYQAVMYIITHDYSKKFRNCDFEKKIKK